MKVKSGYASNRTVSAAVRRALFAAAVAATALPPTLAIADDEPLEEVIVTGSILRRTDAETPSPVTVITSEELEQRGINTVSEAVQRLSANNAGTITAGWNTGFNFASGATAPALRGLTVQDTLSVVDGVRMAPYPLADDGQRNFVDLNTIPSAIIERIEILRDGASSTYGADAIAGVVNVITKKEVQGLHLGGSTARSQEGGGDENHIDLTWGTGSLESQGYNFYISGEYQKTDALWARDRGYPFNSTDLTRICGASGSCMANLNWNGVTAELGDTPASFNFNTIPGVALVRPVTAAGVTAGTGRYQFMNPQAGCRGYPTVNITANQSAVSPLTTCEVDLQHEFIMLQPEVQRAGLSLRFTANVGENAQFYTMANFYKTETHASFTPLSFQGALPPPNPAGLASAVIDLPVYVCAAGIGTFNGENTGCNSTNGVLNPNNPFAGAGQRAQMLLRSPYGRTVDTSSRAIRGVVGIDGSFGDDWRYSANFTTSEIGLQRSEGNYLIPQRIWDVAAKGTFNFADPASNPKEVWDYIAPTSSEYSPARLWQAQATIAKNLFSLPGGEMQAAVGASYREESIDAPSANPGNLAAPYSRYYSVNAVGTSGSRDVKSAFFELNAPVFKQLEFDASGRFDDYSSGQSNFSPKVGFKFTPVEQVALRGTFSKGFRIPSFNEAYGLPTTGYVTRQTGCANPTQTYPAFCAAHSTGAGVNAYATNAYNLGLTQTGNPNLDPEKSTSFTAGVVFEPMTNLSVTVDYWNIEVKNLITGVTNTGPVEQAYYQNNGVVNIPGFVVTPGAPDPQFPNALPVLGFIQSSFANQDKQEVSGIDFGVNFTMPIGDSLTWKSTIDASYLQKFELTTDDGTVSRYDGTLSPCNITSCSGAPKWRGSWQNMVEFGKTTLSLTGYYTGGYDTASIDFGGVKGDCVGNAAAGASTVAYVNQAEVEPVLCNAKAQLNADFTARYKFSDKYTVSLDILNVFDIAPEFDPSAAYSLFQYNPAWGGPNIMGRYFRLGAKFDF
jgi:iron complex outermembrane receptor protein